jgi:capsular polysaccharide export protein
MLLAHARGVVTVNSTSGLTALELGKPTVALGKAIYDMPGMASQCGLREFWREQEPPDSELFDCFRKVVIHLTQVNGGLYSRDGISLAAKNSCAVLTASSSRLRAFV